MAHVQIGASDPISTNHAILPALVFVDSVAPSFILFLECFASSAAFIDRELGLVSETIDPASHGIFFSRLSVSHS
jgi:hypothetical protein